MSFLILILTCVFLFIGTIGLTSWLTRFRMKRYQTVGKSSFCPIESTVAFVFALISLPLFLLLNPMMGMVSVLVLFALVIALLYTEARFSGSLLLGTQYILCLIGTCLIPQNGQLFQTLPVFVTIPVLAFVWLALVRLTVFADKIPYFSSLLITALGLFFVLCGLLGVLPAFITYISLLLCVISFALTGTMRVWTQELKLGTFGALILGFIVPFKRYKTLIYRVDLHTRNHLLQQGHHPAAHISIQSVIAGKCHHFPFECTKRNLFPLTFHNLFCCNNSQAHLLNHLVCRHTHLYPHILCLLTTGNNTSVIVGQDNNSPPFQQRIESFLARDKKIIAIYYT